MPPRAISGSDATQVFAVREFNRFYTARLGLLRKRHLNGEFSLTEARMLYEVGSKPPQTVSSLRRTLSLDAGYISRLLTLLTRRNLICHAVSKNDGREKLLTLSPSGEQTLAELNEKASRQIERLLEPLSRSQRVALVGSLARVRSILSTAPKPPIKVIRLGEVDDDALRLLSEYYDAVSVVQRDTPGEIRKMTRHKALVIWLAYLQEKAVGCVALRTLPSIPFAGECKRLYVQPMARGNGIANLLLGDLEAFACSKGLRWVYLDTKDDLKTAIAVYRKRGYRSCKRYNDNPQATVFLRKRIGT
ncbi:MAG TPA: helix-turn-helix domain-containing GNAT family N-acetyltransferase [Terriglobales bacterium]